MAFLLLLQSLYFFLPAYFANMAPVLLRWLPLGPLRLPVQEKLFGPNKTWRGLIVAPLVAGLIFFLQKVLYVKGFTQLALIDYADFSLALGFAQGGGAILGDLVKSYYKRKDGLKPGERWVPWDQLDFVIGGLIGSFFVYVPPVEVALILLVVSPFLHIAVNHLGYWIKVRESKW